MNSLRTAVVVIACAILSACGLDSKTVLWGDDIEVSPFPPLETADVFEIKIDQSMFKDKMYIGKWRDEYNAPVYLLMDDPKNREMWIANAANGTGTSVALWMQKVNDNQYIVRSATFKDGYIEASNIMFLNKIENRWIHVGDIHDDAIFSQALTSIDVGDNPFEQIQPTITADIRQRLTEKNVLAISNFIQKNLDRLDSSRDWTYVNAVAVD